MVGVHQVRFIGLKWARAALAVVMCVTTAAAAIEPDHRVAGAGVTRPNLARTDSGVTWTANDGFPGTYDAAAVLDGEFCDRTGRDGYWAGKLRKFPTVLELTFPEPRTIAANIIIWYATEIRGVEYMLEGLTGSGTWVRLYQARGNRYRDVVHRFPPRTVEKLRFSLTRTAGQNRVVMREFLLYDGLTPAEEEAIMANAAKCLGANEASRLVNLGVAVKSVMYGNTEGAVGPRPGGGPPVFYTSYYNTGGAELLACDYRTHEVWRYDLPGGSGGYGVTAGLDGRIYIGTVGPGSLVVFDPVTEALTDLGKAGQPTTYIWACATGPNGKIFGAGYPGCIPLVYDPAAAALSSPGSLRPRPELEYLRSVAVDARGRAWFGVGARAALVVYDPADGSWRDILPEGLRGESSVYRLVSAGNRVYASIISLRKVLVFDADSCELVGEAASSDDGGLLVGVADSHGNIYGNTWPDGHLAVIRPGASRAVELAPHFGMVKSILEDRYIHGTFDNQHHIFDLAAGRVIDTHPWIQPRSGMGIYTLCTGPGGKIYGSTFINQHFFRYDPAAGELKDMGRIIRGGGQCDSMCASRDGKRLWLGCYTHAQLSVYDPARPYKLGSDPESNPRNYGPLGQGQYRTCALAEGPLGKIYCGSVPSYASAPTGALTIFDPETESKNVMTDFVPGGTVSCLAANDRFVYGSGGGKCFRLDPAGGTKGAERDLACTAMVTLADGTAVAATKRAVYGLDPETLVSRWEVPLAQVADLAGFHALAVAPSGALYGISDLGLFRIDPAARTLQRLTTAGSRHLAVDSAGRCYFSQGESLYAFDPPEVQ